MMHTTHQTAHIPITSVCQHLSCTPSAYIPVRRSVSFNPPSPPSLPLGSPDPLTKAFSSYRVYYWSLPSGDSNHKLSRLPQQQHQNGHNPPTAQLPISSTVCIMSGVLLFFFATEEISSQDFIKGISPSCASVRELLLFHFK